MKTISEKITNELIIKNSKFITIIYPITSIENIQDLIDETKLVYPKATHYCYAYIINDIKRSSDDKEPSGTAGTPMLNVLIKENYTNILVITVRYFGGIKLGAGGLVRAYSKSVKEALNIATTIDLELGYRVQITASYSKQKELDYLLRNTLIIKKEYQENIEYEVLISKDSIQVLNNYDHQILKEEYIPKINNYL
mgnify:FL=1